VEKARFKARAKFSQFKSQLRDAVLADARLSPSAKLLAGAVLERIYSARGYCGASIPALRRAIGCRSERTVQYAVTELARAGYFRVERGAGGKSTNRFFMPSAIPGTTGANSAPVQSSSPSVQRSAPGWCNGLHPYPKKRLKEERNTTTTTPPSGGSVMMMTLPLLGCYG
jgi:hypothetical protein